MRKIIFTTLLMFVLIPFSLYSQSYHTVTFTGDPATDFNVAESHSSSNGDVTWYFTWDANNIYLGLKSGGGSAYVKDQPSIVYFDTDPADPTSGGTGSTTGFNSYDNRIGTYPFTANLVIYLKSTYAELRINTTGTWGTNTVITSNITTGTGAIEIFVPWSDFPNSTKPSQLYYLMYKESADGSSTGYAFNPSTNRTDGDDVNTISNWSYFGASSTGTGQTPFSGQDTPLPVELTSFNALSTGNSVNLKWHTATEVNNYGFNIERSAVSDQQSAYSWEKIGFVKGNGNSNSPKSYSFEDDNLSSGKYAYRLKQLDNDGQYKYSKIVEVQLTQKPNKFELEQNYPNPFNPTTTIAYKVANEGLVTLKVYNMLGKEVATLVNRQEQPGSYNVQFDGSKLSSGIYIYRLQVQGQNSSFNSLKKFVLLK